MDTILLAAAVVWLYMTGVFLLALRLHDNGIVDSAWGGGFVLIVCAVTANAGITSGRQVVLGVLIAVWAVRLALHVHTRNRGRTGEDFRYRAWREAWGDSFVLRSYMQIFMLQGAVMLVVAAPVFAVTVFPGGALGLMEVLGVFVWGIGFAFEAIGDWQLLRFKRDPANRGAIMMRGLWKYTRHPNYFGEVVLWWGGFLVALGAPHGWWALVSPVTITFLLLRVSGIPMLEKKYEGRADFARYRARTNAFFPWFPKRRDHVDGTAEP